MYEVVPPPVVLHESIEEDLDDTQIGPGQHHESCVLRNCVVIVNVKEEKALGLDIYNQLSLLIRRFDLTACGAVEFVYIKRKRCG